MAGKIHTDSEALYAVRHAITKFADDIQNSQGRFLTCFERMNTQVDNYLRSRECKIEEYSNKRREIEYQFEELNEQERIVRDYVEQNPDGRTDSFLCDICDTRMMLKVMGDTTHCKSSSGCDGTMHRVYNNSEYQKYRTAQAQIEEQKKKLHNLETELSEAIKVLQTEKDETEDLKHTFLMQQDTIIGLLDLNSGVDVDSTIAFIDKALITLGEYQAVTIETTKGELEKKDSLVNNEDENSLDNKLKPNRKKPRDLPETEYGFIKDQEGNLVYDSPVEMGKYLYTAQGSAYLRYQGTCGLCSCANVLRLAGVNYSEKDIIDYASHTPTGDGFFQKLCVYNPINPSASGATNAENRKQILEHFGISSGVFSVSQEHGIATEETINNIAQYVSEGRGVIISVHSGFLYYGRKFSNDYHAVTVTSVVKSDDGRIKGFYICDSNRGTKFYDALEIRQALTGADMNVTYSYIR